MSTDVFYFSGTGNCLAAAAAIAKKLAGTLWSIPEAVRRDSVATESVGIVIVFPCYLAPLSGVPLIVERFLARMVDIGSKRLFAVCTCGGYEIVNALPALRNLNRFVRSLGGRLHGGYSLRMPMNNLDYDHIPVPIERDQERILAAGEKKIADICRRISQGKGETYRLSRMAFNALMTPMYSRMRKPCIAALKKHAGEKQGSTLGFRGLIPLTDNGIAVDDACTGCGMCAQVCPAQNIAMVDDRPVRRHHCEMCFACDEWCPRDAIHHWGRAKGIKYHHPDVKAGDMMGSGHRSG